MGVEFAPLLVPLERRLQTLIILLWFIVGVLLPLSCYPFLVYVFLFSTSWNKLTTGILVVPYMVWMWSLDYNTCRTGGRTSHWFRNLGIWKTAARYFPVTLINGGDHPLDPSRNYLFCVHPHGLVCMGSEASFACDGCGVTKIFPQHQFNVLMGEGVFRFPFIRDVVTLAGVCSASRSSMNHILSHPGGGRVAVLHPGASREALDAHPNNYVVRLKNVKGFVKVALQNGSPLVPVVSFGENDIYWQLPNPRGSTLRNVQEYIQSRIGPPLVIFNGRGIFQHSFGLLPRRRPINVVVGPPIPVDKVDEPTQTDIDDLHETYISGLVNLFNTHRHKYAPGLDLTIV